MKIPGNKRKQFAIVEEPINLNQLISMVARPNVGGVCIFTGIVRGITFHEEKNLKTDYLVYEAYAPMAEQKLQQITIDIQNRFPKVKQVAMLQRIGKLEIGDIAVAVACSAGHRHDGIFAAAEYGINRLKEIVPVWKQEIKHEGTEWVEGSYHPSTEDNEDGL